MKRPLAIMLIVVALILGLSLGGFLGVRWCRCSVALAENKVAVANLSADKNFYGGTNLPPKFREYLKARIYCNIYNYYPNNPGYLSQKDWDFGPVDRQVLGTVSVWKDPEGKVWDWQNAIKEK